MWTSAEWNSCAISEGQRWGWPLSPSYFPYLLITAITTKMLFVCLFWAVVLQCLFLLCGPRSRNWDCGTHSCCLLTHILLHTHARTHAHTHTHTHSLFLCIVGTFHRLLLFLYWTNNILSPNPKPTSYRKTVCIVTLSNKHNFKFCIICFSPQAGPHNVKNVRFYYPFGDIWSPQCRINKYTHTYTHYMKRVCVCVCVCVRACVRAAVHCLAKFA